MLRSGASYAYWTGLYDFFGRVLLGFYAKFFFSSSVKINFCSIFLLCFFDSGRVAENFFSKKAAFFLSFFARRLLSVEFGKINPRHIIYII